MCICKDTSARFSDVLMLITPTGVTHTNHSLCVATKQESTSVIEKSTTAASGEKSCDKSHDLSESDDEIYITPPTTPLVSPQQHNNYVNCK